MSAYLKCDGLLAKNPKITCLLEVVFYQLFSDYVSLMFDFDCTESILLTYKFFEKLGFLIFSIKKSNFI